MHKHKVGLIGRSNVGKSTLLNRLLSQQIAKVSKKPGRTRKHTEYIYNSKVTLIDLPGYGYAQISKERRAIWDDLLLKLLDDEALKRMGVIIDISIPPQEIDHIFVQYLIEREIPYILIFNKKDKQKQQVIHAHSKAWGELLDLPSIPHFFISAKDNKGIEQVKREIEKS